MGRKKKDDVSYNKPKKKPIVRKTSASYALQIDAINLDIKILSNADKRATGIRTEKNLVKIGERHGDMAKDEFKPKNRAPKKKPPLKNPTVKNKKQSNGVKKATKTNKQKPKHKQTKSFQKKQQQLEIYKEGLKENATKAELYFRDKLIYYEIKHIFQKGVIDGKHFMIADFYIDRLKLIVEIDGGYHQTEEQQLRDKLKDRHYLERGFNVLRITNEEAFKSFDYLELFESYLNRRFTRYMISKIKMC